jgi:hypothetical protein
MLLEGASVPVCNGQTNYYYVGWSISNFSSMDVTVRSSNRSIPEIGAVIKAHSIGNYSERVYAHDADILTLTVTADWPASYNPMYSNPAGSSTQSNTFTVNGTCIGTPTPPPATPRPIALATMPDPTPAATQTPTPRSTPAVSPSPSPVQIKSSPAKSAALKSAVKANSKAADISAYISLLGILVITPVALYFSRPILERYLAQKRNK